MNSIPEGFGGVCSESQDMSKDIGELAAALAAAQGEITGAAKGSDNPFFKSKYADLAACWEACRAPLSQHGLAVIQTTAEAPEGVTVITTLAHAKTGQWIRGRLTMTPDKAGPQALGSCITYARRYALAAMVGLAQVDDDAESATFRMSKQAVTKIINALDKAYKADDKPGALEVWGECSNEEKQYVWQEMDRTRRNELRPFLKEAQDAANEEPAPEPVLENLEKA